MTLQELTLKYIRNTKKVLAEISVINNSVEVDGKKVNSIVESARRYLEDAEYYREKKRLETSLASVAYCEGLLDGLRMLGIVHFSWPKER